MATKEIEILNGVKTTMRTIEEFQGVETTAMTIIEGVEINVTEDVHLPAGSQFFFAAYRTPVRPIEGTLVVVDDNGNTYWSEDDGVTWTSGTQQVDAVGEIPSLQEFTDEAGSFGVFGNGQYAWYSRDGKTWVKIQLQAGIYEAFRGQMFGYFAAGLNGAPDVYTYRYLQSRTNNVLQSLSLENPDWTAWNEGKPLPDLGSPYIGCGGSRPTPTGTYGVWAMTADGQITTRHDDGSPEEDWGTGRFYPTLAAGTAITWAGVLPSRFDRNIYLAAALTSNNELYIARDAEGRRWDRFGQIMNMPSDRQPYKAYADIQPEGNVRYFVTAEGIHSGTTGFWVSTDELGTFEFVEIDPNGDFTALTFNGEYIFAIDAKTFTSYRISRSDLTVEKGVVLPPPFAGNRGILLDLAYLRNNGSPGA